MSDDSPLPQYDRSSLSSDINFYQTLFRLHDICHEGVIPARVESYDRRTGKATVRPIVKNVIDTTEGEQELVRPSYDVHVVRFIHGGFLIDAPMIVGDTGWLIASDRNCKSAILRNSDINEFGSNPELSKESLVGPDDNSISKFSNGFFIPASWGEIDENGTGLVIRKIGGEGSDARISIDDESIRIEYGNSSSTISEQEIRHKSADSSCVISGSSISAFRGPSSVIISDNSVLAKRNDGEVEIGTKSSSMKFGNDRLFIDMDGIHYDGITDSVTNIVTDIRYNLEKHCMEQRTVVAKRRGDMIVNVGGKSDWYTVKDSEAVPEYRP